MPKRLKDVLLGASCGSKRSDDVAPGIPDLKRQTMYDTALPHHDMYHTAHFGCLLQAKKYTEIINMPR